MILCNKIKTPPIKHTIQVLLVIGTYNTYIHRLVIINNRLVIINIACENFEFFNSLQYFSITKRALGIGYVQISHRSHEPIYQFSKNINILYLISLIKFGSVYLSIRSFNKLMKRIQIYGSILYGHLRKLSISQKMAGREHLKTKSYVAYVQKELTTGDVVFLNRFV